MLSFEKKKKSYKRVLKCHKALYPPNKLETSDDFRYPNNSFFQLEWSDVIQQHLRCDIPHSFTHSQ